jgi:hypothetical protein
VGDAFSRTHRLPIPLPNMAETVGNLKTDDGLEIRRGVSGVAARADEPRSPLIRCYAGQTDLGAQMFDVAPAARNVFARHPGKLEAK